ncbi:MAG: NF038120 family PEP-CTERM protein [Proteobacteria bacterium]|nr:NF038120 family PEP-CTERM protein [Pseudomonadota bacterium]
MKQSLKMALLSAAIGLTLPAAQASVLNFDAMAHDIYNGGDLLKDSSFDFNVVGGGMAGAITNSASCDIIDCPKGNSSNFYLASNDSGFTISNSDNLGFLLSSFESSLVAPVAQNIPFSVAKLIVSGRDINNVSFADYFDLPGQNAAGNWTFSQFNFTNPARIYKEVSFFSCLTTTSGDCVDISANQSQFAIDNINVTAVPEPAEWLLMMLGLASITMVMRRKNKAQNNSAGIAS